MDLNEVMKELEELGSEQTKKVLMKHGIKEPLLGVKITDMKKLVRLIKKDDALVREVYNTGVYDAMYLAGLAINSKSVTRELLEQWLNKTNCSTIATYTVASVAAESKFALELARKWIKSDEEKVSACGWSTFSNYISITPDEILDLEEINNLLSVVEANIHGEKNKVKYNMNGFVISVGTYIKALHNRALEAAATIGRVEVYMGETSCKVPLAKDYIEKIETMNRVGVKRKKCRC